MSKVTTKHYKDLFFHKEKIAPGSMLSRERNDVEFPKIVIISGILPHSIPETIGFTIPVKSIWGLVLQGRVLNKDFLTSVEYKRSSPNKSQGNF